MSAVTPTVAAQHELLYGAKRLEDDELDSELERLDLERIEGEQVGKCRRPSIYVDVFEQMFNTIHKSESHLLTQQEIKVVDRFSYLDYNARYCLVRLILRKRNTWHTVVSMEKFKREVGEDGLHSAIEVLCRPINEGQVKKEEVLADLGVPEAEIIDLTGGEEEMKPFAAEDCMSWPKGQDVKPSLDTLLGHASPFSYEPNFDFFLQDESSMTLAEALQRLNVEQLKVLVKDTKTKPLKMNKPEMIAALHRYAYTQSSLVPTDTTSKGKPTKDGLRQTTLSFKLKGKAPAVTQEHRLLQMVLQRLGKCVRVNIDLYWLVARLNVIYDRSTGYPQSLLVPSLLTSFKKRTYPDYIYERDPQIWPTRAEFVNYFEVLWLEDAIEQELEPLPPGRPSTKTPASVSRNRDNFVTPLPPPGRLPTPMSGASGVRFTESPAMCKKEDLSVVDMGDMEPAEVPFKVQAATRVKNVFHEKVFPKWKELVALKQRHGVRERSPGLERFEPGFVYTRIFSKVARALATLKLYEEEAMVLDALLEQSFWRRGKRAKWYERRALLQMTHLCYEHSDDGSKKTDMNMLRSAMEGVHQALKDEDTGLVFRPGLIRRLRRLENKLKVPEEQRAIYDGELRKAGVVEFLAERLWSTSKSLKLDNVGRPIDGSNAQGLRKHFSPVTVKKVAYKENQPAAANPSNTWKWKGKSIWRGADGDEVNVEGRALQYYEVMGYKGFHSETLILTTIFALLFWDIIFAHVPGAFETPYQTAPLDLTGDCFYHARKKAIDTRLEELKEKGRARELLERHDDMYREKKTWCIGVRWDLCEKQDLLEIVECLGGQSLSIICRLFCEDYAGRSSGVPDLVVWDTAKGICKFVEVKGPGDKPQENQKLWFDSLLGAGANVEICHVHDQEHPPLPKSVKSKRKGIKGNRKPKSKGKGKARVGDSDVEMDSDDDQVDQLDENPWNSPDPPPILGKRRRKPPDGNDDQLPIFHSSATPPTSPSVAQRPDRREILLRPLKRRKTSPGSP